MAIFTPRGLKIRMPVDYAFGLMGRLSPVVDAFTVLKTTEAFECLPSAMALLGALICFVFRIDPWLTGACVFALCVYGRATTTFGWHLYPGMLKLGLVYSNLSGYGLLLVVAGVLGYFTSGYKSVVAYVAGRLLGGVFNQWIEWDIGRRAFRELGMPLWGSEINFLNAYRWHASSLGTTADLEVSPQELTGGSWKICLSEFVGKWPQVAQRFTE